MRFNLTAASLREDHLPTQNDVTPGSENRISYKVSEAARLVGHSRYVIYDAICNRELPVYRPSLAVTSCCCPTICWHGSRDFASTSPDGFLKGPCLAATFAEAAGLPASPRRITNRSFLAEARKACNCLWRLPFLPAAVTLGTPGSQPSSTVIFRGRNSLISYGFHGAPNRIRTGVLALRGLCPGPLDDGSGVGSTRRSRAL